MWRKACGFVVILSVGALLAADPKDAKDKEKKDGKAAKVVKVNVEKMILTVQTEDGKKLDISITDEVEFVGPRGGKSKERLKDDRLKVGNEVTLVYDASGKKVKEIRLPYRETEKDKGDKDKAKDKTKPKDK